MFLIGLTGGIATGKSTVSKMLIEKGLQVIDADQVYSEVVRPGSRVLKKIVAAFGPSMLDASGCLNRTALAENIFKDSLARQKLNAITHPEIYKTMAWKCLCLLITGHRYVILDLPLLFESGKMIPFLRNIVVVNCSQEQQLERLMRRNGFNQEVAEQRMASQWPLTKKCALANFVIDNSGCLLQTKTQVLQLVEKLDQSKAFWKLRIFLLGALLLVLVIGKSLAALLFS